VDKMTLVVKQCPLCVHPSSWFCKSWVEHLFACLF